MYSASRQESLILSLKTCKDNIYWMKSGLHFLQQHGNVWLNLWDTIGPVLIA